jgi:hypothetical protein
MGAHRVTSVSGPLTLDSVSMTTRIVRMLSSLGSSDSPASTVVATGPLPDGNIKERVHRHHR